jgi:hypothetical protein
MLLSSLVFVNRRWIDGSDAGSWAEVVMNGVLERMAENRDVEVPRLSGKESEVSFVEQKERLDDLGIRIAGHSIYISDLLQQHRKKNGVQKPR